MIRKHIVLGLLVCGAALATAGPALAQTANSKQSPLRPLGLQLWDSSKGKVMRTGSDSDSQLFNNSQLNAFLSIVDANLGEAAVFQEASNNNLAPDKLFFFQDYAPRMYFLSEGAGYTNGVGATICPANASRGQVPTGTTFLIFPSTQCSLGLGGSGSGKRSTTEPVLCGDFVQLPTIKKGEQLELFLLANMNGSAVPEATYYNEAVLNPDRLLHLVAFFPNNSRYIILGFEDILGGGDLDYNDVVMCLDVGEFNAGLWRDPTSLPK